MLTTSSRDSWERLVAAVIKREQIWQLCHQDSITTINSSHFSSFSSNTSLIPISSSLSPHELPLIIDSVVGVEKNAYASMKAKIFSALFRRMKQKDDDMDEDFGIPEDLPIHLGERHWRISRRELIVATNNFSNTNILGHGRHSKVYKGRLADRSLVAVKRLTAEPQVIGKELEISSIVKHGNVLRLRRFCITEKERLLVYPFMVNGSVASWLRERPETEPPLDWETRQRIALGAAKGLAYLHYGKIIHFDVKAANILLDEGFEAVVADFNLAEFMDCCDEDVPAGVRGTIGHIAPEYYSEGKCSEKTDVFGYGMFLLELITAQKAYDVARASSYDNDVMLLNGIKRSYRQGAWRMMVDVDLEGNFEEEEVEKLLQIGLICTQTDSEGRPTMPEVVMMLEDGDGFDERRIELLFRIDFGNEYVSEVNSEWTIADSIDTTRPEELSGPR